MLAMSRRRVDGGGRAGGATSAATRAPKSRHATTMQIANTNDA